ncbi:MAG: hypothetical protein GX558_07170 [Clostridiales bacterium]|nr:hypothetical protein [Clostridiales bacterium]
MMLVVVCFALIAAIDLPPLIRQKSWREMAVMAALWCVGAALAVLLARGVVLPSVLMWLDDLFRAMGISY